MSKWAREITAGTGLALFVFGCLVTYPPAALLSSGAVLLYLGIRR